MDSADEQDVENPGGMTNGGANGAHVVHGANGANGQHPTPEGSLSYREDESDLDDEVQDEEELLSQPLQGSSQLPMDIAAQAASTSSFAHFNNILNLHPQLMAKLRHLNEAEQVRNGVDALQAAMITQNISLLPNMFMSSPPPTNLLLPGIISQQQQQQYSQNNHSQPIASNPGHVENHLMAASTSVRPPTVNLQNDESPRNCRNNSESSQGSSRNNGESRECDTSRPGPSGTQNPHPPAWNFEEQFRQLYELDDNPERKEFLDNLFHFMQKRGSPINRLPIMAKSVLDLYELYKLVVLRGGLVEVINKKLWQEIIKGLRLPASITSAAFTLRTQYMKYLYPYEQDKEKLSTQEQLQQAIETNRRESRRGNYTTYSNNNDSLVRNQNTLAQMTNQLPLPVPISMAQLELPGSQSPFLNGGHPQQHHSNPNLSDYMYKMLNRSATANNSAIQASGSGSPPNQLELSRLTLWNMYQTNNKMQYPTVNQSPFSPPTPHSPSVPVNSPEPQREALDLANSAHRSDPVSSPSASRSDSSPPATSLKRKEDAADLSSPTSVKRLNTDDENVSGNGHQIACFSQIFTVLENGRRELSVSVTMDGVVFEGVLAAKNDATNGTPSDVNNVKRSQNGGNTP